MKRTPLFLLIVCSCAFFVTCAKPPVAASITFTEQPTNGAVSYANARYIFTTHAQTNSHAQGILAKPTYDVEFIATLKYKTATTAATISNFEQTPFIHTNDGIQVNEFIYTPPFGSLTSGVYWLEVVWIDDTGYKGVASSILSVP